MYPSYLLPESLTRFAILISFTIAFGGLGSIFTSSFLENTTPLRLPEYLVISIAAGLGLVILVAIGLNVFSIPLTRTNLFITFFIICGICLFRLIRKAPDDKSSLPSFKRQDLMEVLVLASLFSILLGVRAMQIKTILVPNWYDGLTHTTILQKFTAKSAIPFDHIYHVGFHAFAFIVHSFWEFNLPETILLSGQWLSAVCGLTFYIFTRRYTHNAYSSILSFIVYSFFLLFPSYLMSWSRYPFLLGLTLLPPAILTSLDWMTSRKRIFGGALIFIISLGLAHYGALVIWFSFILAYIFNKIFLGKFSPEALQSGKAIFSKLTLLIFFLLMSLLPKVFNLVNKPNILQGMLSRVRDPGLSLDTLHIAELVHTHDFFFIFFWILLVLWSFIQNRKSLYVILVWPFMVWLLTQIQYEIIEGSISTFANLIIFLSMPLALSFGLLSHQLLLFMMKLNPFGTFPISRSRLKGFMHIVVIFVLLAGIFYSPQSLDQKTVLFTIDDMLAMKWISNNTPKDAGFLVRSIVWNNNALIPSDGGGWINILTGRRVLIPKIGELYDICAFASNKKVNYIYLGKHEYDGGFDLRLSDLNEEDYVVVYKTQSIEIVSLNC